MLEWLHYHHIPIGVGVYSIDVLWFFLRCPRLWPHKPWRRGGPILVGFWTALYVLIKVLLGFSVVGAYLAVDGGPRLDVRDVHGAILLAAVAMLPMAFVVCELDRRHGRGSPT